MPKESKPTNADSRRQANGQAECSGRHRPRRRRLVWMRCWKWCLLVSVYMTLFACCGCSSSEMSRSQQRHHHHKNQHRTEVTDSELVNESSQLEKPFSIDEEHDKRASCPNCVLSEKNSYRPDKHSSDALRLEAIKYQILSKLGLKSKPNVTSPVPREVILETLGRAEGTNLAGLGLTDSERDGDEGETVSPSTRPLESEPDDYFGRTSEIITFAEPGHTLNGQPLLEFAHSHEDTGGSGSGSELRVKGASLWVRIDFRASVSLDRREQVNPRNLTLWVFRILHTNTTQLSGKEFDEHTEMAASLPVNLSKSNLGWKKFDLTATVREWYASSGSSPRQRLRLLVDCSGCSDLVEAALFRQPGGPGSGRSLGTDPERPYLVIHTDPTQTKRVRRRALDCSGALRGQCCKQRFYVNFKQLGWEDWIIAPGGYYANYCRGDCGGIHRTPDTFLNYYTHVMEEFRKMDRLSGMQPCCAPLKFSSMSLIYFGPDSNIIKRDLPKMVVDECGCP